MMNHPRIYVNLDRVLCCAKCNAELVDGSMSFTIELLEKTTINHNC
jgi:hypothetical protein